MGPRPCQRHFTRGCCHLAAAGHPSPPTLTARRPPPAALPPPPLPQGKQLVFVTNNSTKSRAGYLNKFTSLGLEVSAEEIYSSSYAAAAYLESISFPQVRPLGPWEPGSSPPLASPHYAPPPTIAEDAGAPWAANLHQHEAAAPWSPPAHLLTRAAHPPALPPLPQDKKVYVVGEVGILEELDLKGIKHVGGPEDAGKKVELTPGMFLEHDHDVSPQ